MCKNIEPGECSTLFDITPSLWESMDLQFSEDEEFKRYLIVPCTNALFLPWASLEILGMDSNGYCTKWGKLYYWESLYGDAGNGTILMNMIEMLRKYHTDNNLEPKFPDTDLTEYYKKEQAREAKIKAYKKQRQDEIDALNEEACRLKRLWP